MSIYYLCNQEKTLRLPSTLIPGSFYSFEAQILTVTGQENINTKYQHGSLL